MEKKNTVIIFIALFIILISLGLFGVIYLKNNEKVYTVTFDTNGGSDIAAQIVKAGSTINEPISPVREGYDFTYWSLNGEMYNFNSTVNEDITLVANWLGVDIKETAYIITFDANGGSSIESQTVVEGKNASQVSEPTREGYNFLYWTLNNKEYDFNTPVTKDITLVAKWEKIEEDKITYKVTFDTTGGSKISTKTVEEGKTVPKPANPTKSGYAFVEWQLEGKTYSFSSKVTKDITLTAVWKEVKSYSVSFNVTGGSSVPTQTITEGGKVTKPTNPTRSGYTFDKWLLGSSEYNFNTPVNSNITLVATWKEVKDYTVSFNTNGVGTIPSQSVKEGGKASKPADPSKTGYTFVGWTLNGKTYDFNSSVTSDIVLVANFKQKSYTISVAKVDDYSPDRTLTVKEDGKVISFTQINYSDGVMLCKGTNPTVSFSDLEGETTFKVVLKDGTVVTATLK